MTDTLNPQDPHFVDLSSRDHVVENPTFTLPPPFRN
jgi:hypothetical protein